MIERLPLEVFEILYSLLNPKDLIECQCVSQAWYSQWIQLVYQKIHIRGEKQFQQFLGNAAPWCSRGQQVRKLVIEKGHVQPETLGKLPLLYPFVESFMFDGVVLSDAARQKTLHHYQQRKQNEEIFKIKNNFKNWAQYLRQLVEFNGITVAHCILTENYCPHLTHLSLQFNNTNDLTNFKIPLLSAFKNVPGLIYLSLERIFLDINELELIHAYCQRLESLILKSAAFLPMTNKNKANKNMAVLPAPDFRTFECIDSSFSEDVVHWLGYIATKYCYAETLDIGCCTFGDADYNDCLLLLASKCTRLKKLKLSSLTLSKAFLDVLDKQGTCLAQVTLGDGLEYQLQQEMKALLYSRQKTCISELTIHGWPAMLEPGGFHQILRTANNCPFLTHLVLHMGKIQQHLLQPHQLQLHQKLTTTNNAVTDLFSLQQVVMYCPHLTHLTMTEAKLLTRLDESMDYKYVSKLNTLVIENSLFDHHLFATISSSCLQLKVLSLSACIFTPDMHHHHHTKIYLPHHSLDLFIVDSVRVSRHCNVRLGTSRFLIHTQHSSVCYDLMEYEWKRTEYCEGTGNREKLCAKKVKVIKDELEQKTHLSIVCKSIKQLYLTGLEVIKDGYLLF